VPGSRAAGRHTEKSSRPCRPPEDCLQKSGRRRSTASRGEAQRRLNDDELSHLGKVMREMAADGEHPKGLAAIRLMLLTGFRRMEALGLEQCWFSRKEHCIRFPDTKSGAQIRVLGEAAMDCVAAQPAREGSPFVFPADWGAGHFIGVVPVLDRVCARATLKRM
jgi:integrase